MTTTESTTPQDVNRAAWDLRTAVHIDSDFYDTEGVLGGTSSLHSVERRLVGDVAGRKLLHLQCHFGLDTISWARLGARATGVDISPVAIEAARTLAGRAGVDAGFSCADVQHLETPSEPFDVVVSSYGVLCWLGDLTAWARGIRENLRPGGRFVLVEFHPMTEALEQGRVSGTGTYFSPHEAPEAAWTSGTYTDPDAPVRYREYRWQHSVADVVTALLSAGLELTGLAEYPCAPYPLSPALDTRQGDMWFRSDDPAKYPYLFSVTARRRTP